MVDDDTDVDTWAASDDGTDHADSPTLKVGPLLAPGWDTATVRDSAGDPVVVNVTTAARDVLVVFATADSVTVPLFVPVAGDTVTHD